MSAEAIFCSQQSLALREPLFATAPRIESWILLEYPFPFSRKTFEASSLPQDLKERLSSALESVPHSRLLMIKKNIDPAQTGFELVLVKSSTDHPLMTRYHLDTYADLLSIDIEAWLTSSASVQPGEETGSLLLVCTNGKRDRCCALNGLPVFSEMQEIAGEQVWQSSHVGGHRFSANVISLPYGIYYGRLTPPEVRSFVELTKTGQLALTYYRGRTCYTAQQQAGEYYLRSHTGNLAVDDLHLVDSIQVKSDQWQVRFKSKVGEEYAVKIQSRLSDFSIIESCDSPDKAKQQILYQLLGISGW